MRWTVLALLLTASCLAPKGDTDAGTPSDGAASAACIAAGGACVAPGPECLEVVSLSISCGGNGSICCTEVTAAVTANDAGTSLPAASSDGGTSTTTSACSTACEMTCEGDPNCIEMCGC